MFPVSLHVMSLLSYTLRQEMPIDRGVVMNYRLELTDQFGIFKNINSDQSCEASFSPDNISIRQRRSLADGLSSTPIIGKKVVFYDPRIFFLGFFLSPRLHSCSGAQCSTPTKVQT